MSLTKAWTSGGGGSVRQASSGGEVLKTGYIKKLKTMKKKFFVLRAECGDSPSCLEYYDSEKKWKAHQSPKRVITLQSCFNINRRWDLKQRFVVALYTKDDCFCLCLDSEEEAEQWLCVLLSTQRGGEDSAEGEPPRPTFEHVWQVQIQKKGLGSSRNILGPYMLCLTSHSLTLVRSGSTLHPGNVFCTLQENTASQSEMNANDTVEFSLSTIRRCGHSDCFFYMEVGRSSITGAGELWMQTEDTYIAQNMHDAILHAMSSSRNGSTSSQKADADLGPHPRTRSSSANEASKPVSVLQRGLSARYASQSSNQSSTNHGPPNVPSPGCVSAPAPSGGTGSRERCDSLPSRARTISEGPPASHPSPPTAAYSSLHQHSLHHHHHPSSSLGSSTSQHVVHRHLGATASRPHSMCTRGLSYSPPIISSPVSPASGACSTTDSAGSSLSMEEGEGWGAPNGAMLEGGGEGFAGGSHGTRYGHSLTPDEPAILEENADDEYMPWVPGGAGLDMEDCGDDQKTVDDVDGKDYVLKGVTKGATSLTLPIHPLSLIKPSPRTTQTHQQRVSKSASPSQHGEYMEMNSATSPLESSVGYMPMSPGSGVSSSMEPMGFAAKMLQSNMEQKHGYVPMTPGHPPDDGYVDMDPHQNSKEDGNLSSRGEMSPAASSCSVTSGTPSTDTRFSEYHLEKVSSYFTPSEEEDVSHGDDILPMERPVRAYSVGSRPETIRRKNWLEVGNSELVRARAFSVGSQQGGGGGAEKCLRGKGSPSHHHHHRHPVHVFAPSTAAAQRCRGALTPKGSSPKSKKNSKSSSAPHLQALSSSWSGSSTLCSPPASIPSPYSQKSESISTRQGHANPHHDNQDHDLMELDFSRRSVARVDPSRVGKIPGHPLKKPGDVKEDPPYIPMGGPPQQEMMPSSFSPPLMLSSPLAHGVIGTSSASSASVTLEEYVDMNYSKDCSGSDSKSMSGYMEMHPRKSSIASDGNNPADYVNMGGSSEDSRCKAPEASRPIAIKKERREESVVGMGGKDQGRGSSPNFSFASLLSRKSSTGTPPKGPFSEAVSGSSPFTSLRRGRRKQGAADEAEENECSIHKDTTGRGDLPTPTAIFPFSLNSPGSPIRPFPGHYESASKCPVDATSGTVHISYPYVPSSPVATAESVMPIRAQSGRCCDCSVPSGGGTSYPPSRRESKNLNDLHPFSKSNSILISNANISASPPSASDREYANCCPSPPRQSSGKPPVSAQGDYMPMAPSGRSRKTSVVSGPGDYMAMGPPSISSSPDASHLFNAPTMLPSAVQKSSSMDYVCMKAGPSPNIAGSSSPQRPVATAQKAKSPSPGDAEARMSTTVSSAKGSNSDDYVEIDMSKKPPVIEAKESEAVSSRRTSVPKTVVPSVGAYTPSHTGFGYLFHHSSASTSSFSSRLPPVPSSYTWPRKGVEVRKADVASKSKPVDLVSPQNEGKSDDYILMNHDMKPAKSLHPHASNQASAEMSSSKSVSSVVSMKTPPSTTATVTATTTTNTNLTTLSHKSITSSIVTIPEAVPANVTSSTSIPGTVPSSTGVPSSSASLDCATPVPSTKIPIFSTAIQTARKTSIQDIIPELSSINTSGLSTVETSVISMTTSSVAVVTTCPMVTTTVKSVMSGVACCDATKIPISSDFSSITNKTVTTTTAVMPFISSPSVDTIFVSKINPIPTVTNMASTSVTSVSAVDVSTSSVPSHTSGPITIPARTPSKSHIPPATVSVFASSSSSTEPSFVPMGTDPEIKGNQLISRKSDEDFSQETSLVERDVEKAGDGQVKTACKTSSDAKVEIEKSKCIASSIDDSGTDSLTDSGCSLVVAKHGHNMPSKELHEVSFPESSGSSETSVTEVEARAKTGGKPGQQRYESKRSVSRGSGSRDPCRRNSGESHHRAGEERERLREGGRSARVRRRSSDVAKDTQLGASKLNRTASGRSCCQDVEDDSSLYEKLLAPGSRQQQQRKWQHNSLTEKSSGLGSLRRQMSSPSAVPDPDGVYEKLLPTNSVTRRRSGDKAGSMGLSGGEGPTPVFSASSSSASSSSSLASVASSVILGPLRSGITSSPPPLNQQGAAASTGEIHYASLDLAPPAVCDSEEQSGRCGRRSPRLFAGRSGAESPSATSVNSNSLVAEQPLNYAEIDFTKSVAVKNRLRH